MNRKPGTYFPATTFPTEFDTSSISLGQPKLTGLKPGLRAQRSDHGWLGWLESLNLWSKKILKSPREEKKFYA